MIFVKTYWYIHFKIFKKGWHTSYVRRDDLVPLFDHWQYFEAISACVQKSFKRISWTKKCVIFFLHLSQFFSPFIYISSERIIKKKNCIFTIQFSDLWQVNFKKIAQLNVLFNSIFIVIHWFTVKKWSKNLKNQTP